MTYYYQVINIGNDYINYKCNHIDKLIKGSWWWSMSYIYGHSTKPLEWRMNKCHQDQGLGYLHIISYIPLPNSWTKKQGEPPPLFHNLIHLFIYLSSSLHFASLYHNLLSASPQLPLRHPHFTSLFFPLAHSHSITKREKKKNTRNPGQIAKQSPLLVMVMV